MIFRIKHVKTLEREGAQYLATQGAHERLTRIEKRINCIDGVHSFFTECSSSRMLKCGSCGIKVIYNQVKDKS